ncbi:MAG: hypothetical protein KatS3mg114_1074 [Planctomycetaceae bacterium]|nr:MAG: hypothetical protein KatS3mg114_1074 [Planctomycetaceae bacterium]
MMRVLGSCLVLTGFILGWCVDGVYAQAEKKGKKKDAQPGANHPVFQLPRDVDLTPEQQAKLDALKKEWGPKVAEAQKKLDDILTPEQRQARKDAQARAKSENLKGKAAQQAIEDAMKLTADQRTKYQQAQAELQDLQAKIREKIAEMLTEEQRAKIPAFSKKKKKA